VYIDNLVAGKKYWLMVKHRTIDEEMSLIDGSEEKESYDSDFSLKLHFAEKDIYNSQTKVNLPKSITEV
jgi:hypothetical protein